MYGSQTRQNMFYAFCRHSTPVFLLSCPHRKVRLHSIRQSLFEEDFLSLTSAVRHLYKLRSMACVYFCKESTGMQQWHFHSDFNGICMPVCIVSNIIQAALTEKHELHMLTHSPNSGHLDHKLYIIQNKLDTYKLLRVENISVQSSHTV